MNSTTRCWYEEPIDVNGLLARMCAGGPVVTDGAWGTQLQARGLPIGGCPDAWNLPHPERVEEVASAYVAAGSRVILTNTFGANRIALAPHGLADKTAEINRAGAAISHRAAGSRARVFGSIGPTGKMLAIEEVPDEAVRDVFSEQARALAEGGVDALVIETMTDLREATLAVRAAVETGLPVIACMVFDSGPNRTRTLMGVTPEEAATALADAGATAIGANCGGSAEQMLPVCTRLRAATRLPLWLKPNAGLPEWTAGGAVYNTNPEMFVAEALELVRAGANFIGGCCGTGPTFIRLLAQTLLKKARL